MTKPSPVGGLVVRYDYLWISERGQGREEGSKNRPCAVVVALPAKDEAPLRAMLCGITHSEPTAYQEGMGIPAAVRRYLGLDEDKCWTFTSEVNIVDCDDPGLIPVAEGQWVYAFGW